MVGARIEPRHTAHVSSSEGAHSVSTEGGPQSPKSRRGEKQQEGAITSCGQICERGRQT